MLRSSNNLYLKSSPIKILHLSLFSVICATCHANLFPSYFITLIIFGDD